MKVKLKIHRDDTVKVIAGKNKGRIGKVVAVMPQEQRVLVEGINLVKRHVKPQQDRAGSIIEKEAPIAISNVALWDAQRGETVKVGYATIDGKKVRVDRKSGAAV